MAESKKEELCDRFVTASSFIKSVQRNYHAADFSGQVYKGSIFVSAEFLSKFVPVMMTVQVTSHLNG
jgi:hypothetical protein